MTPRQIGYEMQYNFNKHVLDNDKLGELIEFGFKAVIFLFIAGYVIFIVYEALKSAEQFIQRFKK